MRLVECFKFSSGRHFLKNFDLNKILFLDAVLAFLNDLVYFYSSHTKNKTSRNRLYFFALAGRQLGTGFEGLLTILDTIGIAKKVDKGVEAR